LIGNKKAIPSIVNTSDAPRKDTKLRWPRLFGQSFRFDEWSLCRG